MSKVHSAEKLKQQRLIDLIFRKTTWFFTLVVFSLLAAIMGSLLIGSLPAIKAFGLDFLVSAEWNPVTEKFGALVPIIGTLVTSLIALSIGIPGYAARWVRPLSYWRAFPALFMACGGCSYLRLCLPEPYNPGCKTH